MTESHHPRLAYHHHAGDGPTVIFLPGYASDMTGTKAVALEAWAKDVGRAFVRFDYAGCGQSEGDFEDQTLAGWLADALIIIDDLVTGPVVLVGSSMGGWLMLLAALARPERVVGMVGVAPAPDFTDWGFTADEKMTLLAEGRLEQRSEYSPMPTVTTRSFWTSGEASRLMFGPINLSLPTRILHGQRDKDVPWNRSVRLMELLAGDDVQLNLIKDGDHRLSRPKDIAQLIQAVVDVIVAVDMAND